MIPSAPSPDAHPSSRQALEAQLATLAATPLASREEAAALCEVAGRLSLAGHAPAALAEGAKERLRARLAEGLGLERLEDEAALLSELLDDDDERDGSGDDALVREAMRSRDRAEWMQEGARCLLGADEPGRELAETDALAIATFDETIRAALPRVTRWNHVRAEGLTTASSAEKRRFRWRAEEVGIDPGAWDAMSAVAALVAAHPDAASRFEALVAAERGLRQLKAR